jgi:ribosome-binding factor A
MDPRRSQRVTEALREELDELIAYELDDPRVGDLTVTEVLLSPDGKKASVRVRIEGDEARQTQALEALSAAKGFLKHQLVQRVTLFRVPELKFEADLTPALAVRMDSLMKRVRRGRPKDAAAE